MLTRGTDSGECECETSGRWHRDSSDQRANKSGGEEEVGATASRTSGSTAGFTAGFTAAQIAPLLDCLREFEGGDAS
jgi:hypothetical protein